LLADLHVFQGLNVRLGLGLVADAQRQLKYRARAVCLRDGQVAVRLGIVNANHMRRNQVAGLKLLQRIGSAGMRALIQDVV
jgi:hypothetical protein